MQDSGHSAGVLGDLVEEGIPDQLGLGVAFVGHLAHGAGIVGVQVTVETAVATDLLVNFLLGVLAAEAHLDQVANGYGAAALGAEAAFAVQNVVDIDDLAVIVGADRNAAAHVDDDKVQILACRSPWQSGGPRPSGSGRGRWSGGAVPACRRCGPCWSARRQRRGQRCSWGCPGCRRSRGPGCRPGWKRAGPGHRPSGQPAERR